MATHEQEKEVRALLKEALENLSAIDVTSLERTAELGTTFSFQDVKVDIERILELFTQLKNIPLEGIAKATMDNLLNQANDALTKLEQIGNFKPEDHPENPKQIRDNYANQIRDSYDGYFSHLFPVIAYGRARGEDFKELQKQAQLAVDSIEQAKTNFNSKQTNISAEIDSVLNQVRDSAGKIGVTKYASFFEDESVVHKEISKEWLKGTIGLAVATVWWGFYTFLIQPDGGYKEWIQLIPYTVPKLIILSVFFTALVWTAKNYQAHRHNYVINKHRQNSLSTFEGFVNAAGDDIQTKNAVLLQATQSIFAPQSTGYTSTAHEAESPQKVIEIFRSMGDVGKGG